MVEYIEREALMNALDDCSSWDKKQLASILDELPPADVAPVAHGRWINRTGPDDDLNVTDTCSRCLHTDTHSPTVDIPYCWHCGAKMDLEGD